MLLGKHISAIVPAAGKGSRMWGEVAKQFLELLGKPILVHTLERLEAIPEIDKIIVAAAQDDLGVVKKLVADYDIKKVEAVIVGGDKRQDSVWNCLQQLRGPDADLVIIHDAVRPFVTRDVIIDVCRAAIGSGAAIPVILPKDTIKTLDRDGHVRSTLNRDELAVAQTPQAFQFSVIFQSYRRTMGERFYGTDDASLVERYGGTVKTVAGTYSNIKITTPEDIVIAQHITTMWA